ncbi:cwf18 pre-mrna splicing factor [Ophiostoma piceae UAMH 11346]|uniref:Cwf18 pre-mrna splicing factor n=1 Tax=Ophiostoma piceae (strain UAMH 11346) TaxID=1262450 RepID=S3C963_OPHP1|nr:cwf18 pre-mrna splicing factor [Ophiostoma piceae UAMH 11346]
MSSNATLGAAVDDRKARLAKLRSIKRKQPGDEIVPPESDRASPAVASLPSERNEEDEGPKNDTDLDGAVAAVEPDVARLHLSGRNYDPETRGAKLGFETQPDLAADGNTVEAKAAQLEVEVRRQQDEEDGAEGSGAAAAASKPIDLFKLQPKKPNWDLKRELNKRLEPLNARTDNAIAKLLRSRLQQQQPVEGGASSKAAENTGASGEGVLEGAALVEGIRIREHEAEEEARRERELEDGEDA